MTTAIVYVKTMPQEVGAAAALLLSARQNGTGETGAKLIPYELGKTPMLPKDTEMWITFGTYFAPETLNTWPGNYGMIYMYEAELKKYPCDKLTKNVAMISTLENQTHIRTIFGDKTELPLQLRLLDERNRIQKRAPADSPAGYYHLALTVEKLMTVENLIAETTQTIDGRAGRGRLYSAVVESQNKELARRALVIEKDGLKVAVLDGLLNLGTLGFEACEQYGADVAILTRHDYQAGLLRFSTWTKRDDLDLVQNMTTWYGHLPGFRAGGQRGNAGGSISLSGTHPFLLPQLSKPIHE